MKIPICDHIFHINCLKKWLVEWQKCPTCECNIIRVPDSQKKDFTQKYDVQKPGGAPNKSGKRSPNTLNELLEVPGASVNSKPDSKLNSRKQSKITEQSQN